MGVFYLTKLFKYNNVIITKLKYFLQVKLVLIFGLLIHTLQATNNDKPSPTITRTEIRVAKSLNTEDTQTLNVMTKDGSVAQLIVKKRDGKSKSSSTMPSIQTKRKSSANSDITRSFYSNWIPVQSMYLHPNLLRLSTFALLRNNSEDKPAASNTTVVPTTTVRFVIVFVYVYIYHFTISPKI